ncbi:MAG: hypothetical protein FE834_03815 [Gammaproteobacteria bacterium]|nr:hypothetical protein [Gammaproteobacteria bacterium]
MNKEENKVKIQQECRALYKEIVSLNKKLGYGSMEQMYDPVLEYYDDGSDGEKSKLKRKIKRMLSRKAWEKDTATPKTRNNLINFRDAIPSIDKYKKSIYSCDLLPSDIGAMIDDVSDDLEKFCICKDFEY